MSGGKVKKMLPGNNIEGVYKYPKPFMSQVQILQKLVPGIKFVPPTDKDGLTLPEGAEGWFAIPRWRSLGFTYEEALEKVLSLIGKYYDRDSYFFGIEDKEMLTSQYLGRDERTEGFLAKIGRTQEGNDILIVPAQFGAKYHNMSEEQASNSFSPNEFGLGIFEVACMLLTHPERIIGSVPYCDEDGAKILCVGDGFAPPGVGAKGYYACVPFFHWYISSTLGLCPEMYKGVDVLGNTVPTGFYVDLVNN